MLYRPRIRSTRLLTLGLYGVAVAVVGLLLALGVSLLLDPPEAGRWIGMMLLVLAVLGALTVLSPVVRRR
jgi:hypothetical protein